MRECAAKTGPQYVKSSLQNQRQAIADTHGIDVRDVGTNDVRLRQWTNSNLLQRRMVLSNESVCEVGIAFGIKTE